MDAPLNDESPPFRLTQIYMISAGFGYRVEPLSLPPSTPIPPQQVSVGMRMETLVTEGGGEAAQVVIGIKTNPENADEGAFYDFHVEIAAVVDNIDRTKFNDHALTEVVGAMIYPFIREAVGNLTSRGRFGPVWLNPFSIRAAIQGAMPAGAGAQKPE